MIDVLQFVKLRPEVQSELEARYRVHSKTEIDNINLDKIRAVVTKANYGPTAEIIDRLPNLEIIGSASVGYDGIAVTHAQSKGIPVTFTPDVLNDDVADLTIALMTMASRRLVAMDRYVRDGDWQARGEPPLTHRVSGKRVGILGMGRIGKQIAKRLEAMGCPISYHARNRVVDVPYAYFPTLVEMAKFNDFLVVVLPSNANTRQIVNKDVLESLGPSGILINVARGAVVDEDALVEALVSGKLGGAGLDVFANEPNVPDALKAMDNVILQPHLGSATYEVRRNMSQLVLDNLDAHFAGKPLLTPIPS
jgi:lactate dehydrogenase-like 2-hydroxyacid dehydrogenase